MLTDEELGARLKLERQRLGLSQAYLADLLNHDQTYVSKVETGNRQLTVVDFCSWCRVLNLSVEKQIGLMNLESLE